MRRRLGNDIGAFALKIWKLRVIPNNKAPMNWGFVVSGRSFGVRIAESWNFTV
jgi:hypothetical protein